MKLTRILACLLLVAATAAHAQYAQVKAKLVDGSGNVSKTAFLHFELQNCGLNFPSVAGNALTVVRTSFDLKPNQLDGSILGQVIGTDVILCGNVASAWYHVTPFKDSANPAGPGQNYTICSSANCYPFGSFWDPSNAPPLDPGQTLLPGFNLIYQNPRSSQTIVQPLGTNISFYGAVDFTHAIVTGLPGGGGGGGGGTITLCPSAPAGALLLADGSGGCAFTTGLNLNLQTLAFAFPGQVNWNQSGPWSFQGVAPISSEMGISSPSRTKIGFLLSGQLGQSVNQGAVTAFLTRFNSLVSGSGVLGGDLVFDANGCITLTLSQDIQICRAGSGTYWVRNGSSATSLGIQLSWTNASTWCGFRMFGSQANNDYEIGSDQGTSLTCGYLPWWFKQGGNRVWGFPSTGNFTPFNDNVPASDIGDPAHRVHNLYVGTGILCDGVCNTQSYLNESGTATGTRLGYLAKATTNNPQQAIQLAIATDNQSGILGVVTAESDPTCVLATANCITGRAYVAQPGSIVQVATDGGVSAGEWLVPSNITFGQLHDSGVSCKNLVLQSLTETQGCSTTGNAIAGFVLMRVIKPPRVVHRETFGSSCTTAASIGSTCTSVYTWALPEPDANYVPFCQVTTAVSGVPLMATVTNISNTAFTVKIVAVSAVAAQASQVTCDVVR